MSQPRWVFRLAANIFPGALYAVDSPSGDFASRKAIALTIDDGPGSSTSAILDVLEQYGVKATFFNISSHLPGHEATVRRAVSSGHELGNHLTADVPSIHLSPKAFEADLLAAEADLLALLPPLEQERQTLQWLRPGMGFYNSEMVRIAERHGYQLVLGSCFPYDTHIPSSRFASAFILRTIQPGDIIVLHDGDGKAGDSQAGSRGDRTVQTLQTLLPALQNEGYTLTTLSELTAHTLD